MLNKEVLTSILKSKAAAAGWEKGSGAEKMMEQMIDMMGDLLEYILTNNQVNVTTSQGPGIGKMQ